MFKRTLFILALTAASQSFAAEEGGWLKYASGADGSNFYWKPSSLKNTGPAGTVWTKLEPIKPQPVDENNPKGKKFTFAVISYAFNCESKLIASRGRYDYDAKGVVVWSGNWPYAELRPVIPDSVGESLLELVCP